MQPALPTSGVSSQTHQGGPARFIRRLGGAVRGVIAGGIALAGGRRCPAAPQPSRTPAAPRDPAPPSARKPRAPRRPRAAAPVSPPQPARPGWLARWFGRNRPQRATLGWPPFPDNNATPFTPEAFPGLSPEACAFFNTPVEECDPHTLRVVLAALAQQIADSMPPELGTTDAGALLASMLERLGVESADAPPDASPTEAPTPAPAEPDDAAPDASPMPAMEPTAPSADDATTTAVAERQTAPSAASLTRPAFNRDHARFDLSRLRRRRPLVDRSRSRRFPPGGAQPLPTRRLCYAACAGPP